jgi:hypothetical protein
MSSRGFIHFDAFQAVSARIKGRKIDKKHGFSQKNSEETTTFDEQKSLKRSRLRYTTSR